MGSRKNEPYKEGELEVILSLVPTRSNIDSLSRLLDRSPRAIEIVYKLAYERSQLGVADGDIQLRKVLAAKKKVGIEVGPKRVPPKKKA